MSLGESELPRDIVKVQIVRPHTQSFLFRKMSWALEFAFLTISQVILRLMYEQLSHTILKAALQYTSKNHVW